MNVGDVRKKLEHHLSMGFSPIRGHCSLCTHRKHLRGACREVGALALRSTVVPLELVLLLGAAQHLGSMHAKTRVCTHRQIFGGNSKTESPPNSNPSSRASPSKVHETQVDLGKQSTVQFFDLA